MTTFEYELRCVHSRLEHHYGLALAELSRLYHVTNPVACWYYPISEGASLAFRRTRQEAGYEAAKAEYAAVMGPATAELRRMLLALGLSIREQASDRSLAIRDGMAEHSRHDTLEEAWVFYDEMKGRNKRPGLRWFDSHDDWAKNRFRVYISEEAESCLVPVS